MNHVAQYLIPRLRGVTSLSTTHAKPAAFKKRLEAFNEDIRAAAEEVRQHKADLADVDRAKGDGDEMGDPLQWVTDHEDGTRAAMELAKKVHGLHVQRIALADQLSECLRDQTRTAQAELTEAVEKVKEELAAAGWTAENILAGSTLFGGIICPERSRGELFERVVVRSHPEVAPLVAKVAELDRANVALSRTIPHTRQAIISSEASLKRAAKMAVANPLGV